MKVEILERGLFFKHMSIYEMKHIKRIILATRDIRNSNIDYINNSIFYSAEHSSLYQVLCKIPFRFEVEIIWHPNHQ